MTYLRKNNDTLSTNANLLRVRRYKTHPLSLSLSLSFSLSLSLDGRSDDGDCGVNGGNVDVDCVVAMMYTIREYIKAKFNTLIPR